VRARRIIALGAVGAAFVLVCLLLAASPLLAKTSAYPRARLAPGGGLDIFGECPTYGSQVGSVRSPLCTFRIARQDWFETRDAGIDVYHWYETRYRTWNFDAGRLHAELRLDYLLAAAPSSGLSRFGVENWLTIDISQP
jgi:hypothetical protein